MKMGENQVYGYNKKTGKPTLTTEGVKFSRDFVLKLEKIMENLNKDQSGMIDVFGGNLTREGFKRQIDDLIIDMAPASEKEILRMIISREKQFDLNRSIASVTGYCGEIRATALLYRLTGDDTVRGTGALRDDLHKAEIPIDVVCKANGFQIKNYTLSGKKVTFSNTLSSFAWIDGRMRLTGSLKDILIDLFGVYQYNQPFTSESGKNFHADMNKVKEYESKYYNKFYSESDKNSLFYQFTDIFDSRVPSMLKIYENFSVAGDADFSTQQIYFNTFFWINEYLVPSSFILTELIKQLTKKKGDMIQTKYTILHPDRNYSLQKKPSLVDSSTMQYMAKKLKIEYEIDITFPNYV